jgi:hypothetical protein
VEYRGYCQEKCYEANHPLPVRRLPCKLIVLNSDNCKVIASLRE